MVARHDQTTDPELLAALLQARRGTAHIGYNARAIARLVAWAGTGVDTPMYASTAVRDHEIDFGATLRPIALRHLLDHSALTFGDTRGPESPTVVSGPLAAVVEWAAGRGQSGVTAVDSAASPAAVPAAPKWI